MKKLMMLCLYLLIVCYSYSYENSMIDLKTPTGLEQGMIEFNILHRARGAVTKDAEKTFLGLDSGMNYSIGLRYIPINDLDVQIGHTGDMKEYFVGSSYTYNVEDIIKLKGAIDFIAFEKPTWSEKRANFYYNVSGQSYTLFERIVLTGNLGYDGYYDLVGCGVGTAYKLNDRFKLLGEYYPMLDSKKNKDLGLGTKSVYSFAFKIETPGHHIMITLGNSTDMGAKNVMRGTNNKDLCLGLNLTRIW